MTIAKRNLISVQQRQICCDICGSAIYRGEDYMNASGSSLYVHTRCLLITISGHTSYIKFHAKMLVTLIFLAMIYGAIIVGIVTHILTG